MIRIIVNIVPIYLNPTQNTQSPRPPGRDRHHEKGPGAAMSPKSDSGESIEAAEELYIRLNL